MARIALVGCGRHMQNTLAPYLQRLGGHQIVVCVDPIEESARKVQLIIGANCCVKSMVDLEIDCIDAAIIAAPGPQNKEVMHGLMGHNIACFVEKPPADGTDEIAALLSDADSTGTYVQVGFNFRFADAVRSFQSHIAPYRLEPCFAEIDFMSKNPSGPEWNRSDPLEAWLYHNGVHGLDLLRWMLGDVVSVYAQHVPARNGRFLIVCSLKHTDGSVSIARLGSLTNSLELRAHFVTPDGREYRMPHLGEVILARRDGNVDGTVLYRTGNLDSGWARAGYGPELAHFLKSHRDHQMSSPSLVDALKASQLCDAVLDSLRRGEAVPVPC